MKKVIPLVSIVVVNYNGRKYLKKCFDSLLGLNYPGDKIEILMVDNCSEDDSVNFVEKNFPKVKILKNDINNYARANNLGIKKSKGSFIAFINNDIQVDRNWLVELVNIMNLEDRSGASGGKILLRDGRIHSTGHEEYPNFYWGDRGFRHEDKGQYEHIEEVQSLCGAAILFRKSCLDAIGPFDEDFIMYLEDIDMCFRCSGNKWKVLYVPKSTAMHYFRGTSCAESARYFSERNRLLLIAKHFPGKLGEALYGKGYFTGSENSIYDVFPLIFTKLLECQTADVIKTILPDIFKNFKNTSILEKSILLDRIEEFKDITNKDRASLAELSRANGQLNEQIRLSARESELKESLLKEKEASLAELSRANGQLQEQVQAAAREAELKGELLKEKEASLAELSRANGQLNEQILQREIQLHRAKEELAAIRGDLEKMVRFDQKIKILIVKPQRVAVEDTEKTVRIIKKKYPNSYVYLFANLLAHDYEKLSKNNNIEKSLFFCSNGSKPFIKMPKLFCRLFLTRFDLAVTLLSRKQAENYGGYKKAKLIAFLSNSRNKCEYYAD